MNLDARVEHFIFKLSKPPGRMHFAAQAEEKTLNIYSWSAYLPEQALQRFKDETGIKVKYDIFDSAEALDSKLLMGGSGYDVVFPASSGLARAIQAKAVQPLDRTQLPHLGNLDDGLDGLLLTITE